MAKIPTNGSNKAVIHLRRLTLEEVAMHTKTRMYLNAYRMCLDYVAAVHIVRLSEEEISKYIKRKPEDEDK